MSNIITNVLLAALVFLALITVKGDLVVIYDVKKKHNIRLLSGLKAINSGHIICVLALGIGSYLRLNSKPFSLLGTVLFIAFFILLCVKIITHSISKRMLWLKEVREDIHYNKY